MARNLALDLAPVRVNLMSPGAVMTPLWEGVPPDGREALMEGLGRRCTTGAVGRPEDVAESYRYVMRGWSCGGSVVDVGVLLILTVGRC